MRITPQDIRQQQFTMKMLRGFDPQEVDAFLEDVAEDYESVLKEAALLKEQLAGAEERSRGVTELEKALQEALVMTQRATEDMKTAAKREAQMVVQEAELHGEKLVEAAGAEAVRLRNDVLALKRLRREAIEDLRGTLERYQRLMSAELEPTGLDDDA